MKCLNLNLIAMITTGYLSILNERREVNLYIQSCILDRCGSLVILIDPVPASMGIAVDSRRPDANWCIGPMFIRERLPCRPIVATIKVGS